MPRKVSIWTKIFLIILVAVLPTVGFTIYSALSLQARHVSSRKDYLENLAKGYLNEQRMIVRAAEEMLHAISQSSSVQEKHYQQLDSYLKAVMSSRPDYSVLLVADASGMVVASGVGKTGYTVSDRSYFLEALHSHRFTLGGFIVSRSTGIPSVSYVLPIKTADGSYLYLIASWNLTRYAQELSLNRLEPGIDLEIFDNQGIHLFTTRPEPGSDVGFPVEASLFDWANRVKNEAPAILEIDGIRELVSAGSYSIDGNSLHVVVRTLYLPFLSESSRAAARIFAVMLLACVGAICLSLWLARRLFIRRIERLNSFAIELADGNFSNRSRVNSAQDEITTLIISFNEMAAALEERDSGMRRGLLEKEALLVELRKRISDNLQLLSSMISLQIDHTFQEEARHSLLTVHARVMALALVYETLYRFTDLRQVHMQRYCTGLCDYLISLYADIGSGIEYEVTGSEFSLQIEEALPLAMILNEIVSNCLLHAFPEGAAGFVSISFSGNPSFDDHVVLTVSDNGKGFDGKMHTHDTLGFQLVGALAEQINGSIAIHSNEAGTAVEIRIPSSCVRMSGTE